MGTSELVLLRLVACTHAKGSYRNQDWNIERHAGGIYSIARHDGNVMFGKRTTR